MTMTLAMPDRFTPPVPPHMAAEYARLSGLTDDALRGEFGVALGVTAKHMLKLAVIVRVMEERGHDLSDERIGMLPYLRKIAYGQLLPEALADFGHRPSTLNALAGVPIPDQQKAMREGVAVAVVSEGGHVDQVRLPLSSLTPQQVKAAFANGHVRSPEEQAREQRFVSSRPAAAEREPEPPPYVIRAGRCVVNRPVTLTKRDVQNILKALES